MNFGVGRFFLGHSGFVVHLFRLYRVEQVLTPHYFDSP